MMLKTVDRFASAGAHVWTRRLALACLCGLVLAAPVVAAQGLPTAKPEELGLSTPRLALVSQWLRSEVAQGRIPGAVLLVSRGGMVYGAVTEARLPIAR